MKAMRQIDRRTIEEGDFICIWNGVLQSYWSVPMEWQIGERKIETRIEYVEDETDGLYCAYVSDRLDEDFLSIEPMQMLASEIDALIRQERIDEALR